MQTISNIDYTKVVVNGITIEGWSEDEDALSLPQDTTHYDIKTGADGAMVAGATNTKGGEVTFKLLPNSNSIPKLQALVLAIQNGASITFNGTVRYNDGSIAGLQNGVLLKSPSGYQQGKGGVGTMVYVFHFQNIIFETLTAKFGQ